MKFTNVSQIYYIFFDFFHCQNLSVARWNGFVDWIEWFHFSLSLLLARLLSSNSFIGCTKKQHLACYSLYKTHANSHFQYFLLGFTQIKSALDKYSHVAAGMFMKTAVFTKNTLHIVKVCFKCLVTFIGDAACLCLIWRMDECSDERMAPALHATNTGDGNENLTRSYQLLPTPLASVLSSTDQVYQHSGFDSAVFQQVTYSAKVQNLPWHCLSHLPIVSTHLVIVWYLI